MASDGKPRIHFVSFATPSFRPRQWLLEASARNPGGADRIHSWNPRRLAADGFLERHADLFPNSKGYGWYSWKPYIILKAMEQAAEGDLVVYQDVGRREPILITHRLDFWFQFLEATGKHCVPGVEIPWWGPNKLWTKRLTFEKLGLTQPEYSDRPQVQASWSVWINSPDTREFISEWAQYSSRLELVGGELPQGPAGECEGFQEHRWDQSILTLLVVKHGLRPLSDDRLPLAGFHEKMISAWMEFLGCGQSANNRSRKLQKTAHWYCSGEKIIKAISCHVMRSDRKR